VDLSRELRRPGVHQAASWTIQNGNRRSSTRLDKISSGTRSHRLPRSCHCEVTRGLCPEGYQRFCFEGYLPRMYFVRSLPSSRTFRQGFSSKKLTSRLCKVSQYGRTRSCTRTDLPLRDVHMGERRDPIWITMEKGGWQVPKLRKEKNRQNGQGTSGTPGRIGWKEKPAKLCKTQRSAKKICRKSKAASSKADRLFHRLQQFGRRRNRGLTGVT